MDYSPIGIIACTYRSGGQWMFCAFKDAYYDTDVHVTFEAPVTVYGPSSVLSLGYTTYRHIEPVRGYYGDVAVCHVTRHPIDTALSAHRSSLQGWKMAARRWCGTHHTILEQEGGRWKRIKIEEVWDDIEELKGMAEFFGLDPEAGVDYYADNPIDTRKKAPTLKPEYVPERQEVYDFIDEIGGTWIVEELDYT